MYDGIGATNTPHQRSLGGTYRVKNGSFIFSQFRIISHLKDGLPRQARLGTHT
jgi:hypothetical protein